MEVEGGFVGGYEVRKVREVANVYACIVGTSQSHLAGTSNILKVEATVDSSKTRYR